MLQLNQDARHLYERMKEAKQYEQYFAMQLSKLLVYMPAPIRILNMQTGEWSQQNDPEWQAAIEKQIAEHNNFMKRKFPDLLWHR